MSQKPWHHMLLNDHGEQKASRSIFCKKGENQCNHIDACIVYINILLFFCQQKPCRCNDAYTLSQCQQREYVVHCKHTSVHMLLWMHLCTCVETWLWTWHVMKICLMFQHQQQATLYLVSYSIVGACCGCYQIIVLFVNHIHTCNCRCWPRTRLLGCSTHQQESCATQDCVKTGQDAGSCCIMLMKQHEV